MGLLLYVFFILISSFNQDSTRPYSNDNIQPNVEIAPESKQKARDLLQQAENYIKENKINEAVSALNESKQINPNKIENGAFTLYDMVMSLQSAEFLKTTLTSMSDEDFKLLTESSLSKSYIDHDALNKLFLQKLVENTNQRAVFLTEIEENNRLKQVEAEKKALEETEKKRTEEIEKQFSLWDGSHINLTKVIKESMNDPKSYEHVKTSYFDMKDYLIVITEFRGTNAFGGTVKNTIKAKVGLDGTVLEIIENY